MFFRYNRKLLGELAGCAWFDSQHVERLFRAEVLRMLFGKELITE